MNADLTLSLPVPLKEWVDRAAASKGYRSSADYVREMLRREHALQARSDIDDQLEAALETKSLPMTKADWEELHESVRKQFEQRHPK
jgi:antitoxin ParD1/3/4